MSDNKRIDLNKEDAGKGLAQLVLAIMELIKDLMEKQVLHRVELGALTDEEMESVGTTLMKLDEKLSELKEEFGLTDQDIKLDLSKYIKIK